MFDLIQSPYGQNPIQPGLQKQRIVPAHVLEVCMDAESKMYENPADIGKIRYRDVGNLTPFKSNMEDDIAAEAWPMDRAFGRYPLPGEQVMVFEAFGDVKLPTADALQRISFYAFNVNTNHVITSNQTPFIVSNVDVISKKRVATSLAVKRFENKLIDPSEYRDGSDVKIYPQIQPYEGDFILQGRFGNSIRLGSTAPNSEGKREKGNEALPWTSHGLPGDPIMSLRVNSDYVTDTAEMYVVEDPAKDQGSIYICSTQNIELKLQIPKRMKTWEEAYTITAGSDTKDGQIPSTSKLYEETHAKVVDQTKDTKDQLLPVPTTTSPTDATNQAIDSANENPASIPDDLVDAQDVTPETTNTTQEIVTPTNDSAAAAAAFGDAGEE